MPRYFFCGIIEGREKTFYLDTYETIHGQSGSGKNGSVRKKKEFTNKQM